MDQNFDVISRLEILNGFLSQMRPPELEATSNELATFGLVVTPRQLTFAPPGAVQAPPRLLQPLLEANFRVAISGIPGQGFASVRNLALTVPKVPFTDPSGRLRFNPGTPSFTEPVLASAPIAATLAALEQWAADAAAGQPGAVRSATIQLLAPSLTPVVSLQLTGMQPVTPLDPFPVDGRQSLTVDYQQLQVP